MDKGFTLGVRGTHTDGIDFNTLIFVVKQNTFERNLGKCEERDSV